MTVLQAGFYNICESTQWFHLSAPSILVGKPDHIPPDCRARLRRSSAEPSALQSCTYWSRRWPQGPGAVANEVGTQVQRGRRPEDLCFTSRVQRLRLPNEPNGE